MRLFIQPFDTQFYRDGRPFGAGIETVGISNFIPYPRTIYGAIRSWILGEKSSWNSWPTDENVKKVIGETFDKFGSLSIKGPILAEILPGGNICPYYPVPRDLVENKEKKACLLLKVSQDISLKDNSNLQYNLYPCIPHDGKEVEEIKDHLLPHDFLAQYLTGSFQGEKEALKKIEDILQFEPNLGIALNYKTRTTKLNFLYSVNRVRMNDNAGFIVDIENHNDLIKENGLARLGGDGRIVEYFKIKEEDWKSIKEEVRAKIMEEGRFKLYLVTPAIFEKNSWFPDFLTNENDSLVGNLDNSISIKLVSACIGRPVFVGGFDIRKKHPKEIQKAVPAGSVYFFEIENWDSLNNKEEKINLLLDKFFYKSLEDESSPYSKEGFGLSLIGGWNG